MLRINKIVGFLGICEWGDSDMGYLGNCKVVEEVKVLFDI